MTFWLDPCLEFIGDIQAFKYRLKAGYDEIELEEVRVHPKTLANVMDQSSFLRFMPATLLSTESVGRVAGVKVREDPEVKEGEIFYVVRYNK